ncbi:MAG: inorganic pyrophosphatase [Roseburia sp.]|nr:inorganic pyrophosphatase [Roseburia sp.]
MDNYIIDFWNMLDKMLETHKIIVDRPRNTPHPRYPEYIYPLDYGYLEGTSSPDGEGIDVWIGTSGNRQITAIISSVDYIKSDSEIKILYACTPEEIQLIYKDHNRTDGMKGILNIRYSKRHNKLRIPSFTKAIYAGFCEAKMAISNVVNYKNTGQHRKTR